MSQDAQQEGTPEPTVETAGPDDVLAPVRDLGDVPVSEHVGRFADVERRLRARLDEEPDHGRQDAGTPDVGAPGGRTER
ncbi:hypothetical protein ACNHYB_04255 [Isoptericola jiangsuensis]|uniref:hypothetical protein n=1 Tax=Isoptericola jiangsuensis TaxID=548579 RepID=UPI003AB0ED31